MPYFSKTLAAFAQLLSYPKDAYIQSAELLYVVLQAESPEAAQSIAKFASHFERLNLHDTEEAYTRTFDVNPTCALEIGWHLFGEEYARGTLLVRLRGEMRNRGIEESAELPDHLVHVLALISVMPHDEAQEFVHACVLAALDKMLVALDKAENPYGSLLRALLLVLEGRFGRSERSEWSDESAEEKFARLPAMPQGDPLQSYPMPEPPVELVPLRMDFYELPKTCSHGCQGGGCEPSDGLHSDVFENNRSGEGNG